jgi:quinol---cytochrome c reductase iron-sulfur subunit, bacillus type
MATPSHPPSSDRSSSASPAADRRGFIAQALAVVCGAFALLVPLGAGLVVFFDPLWRRSGLGKLIPVAPLSAVPDDGLPHEFPVIAERIDAWNRSLEPIGAVYLRRQPNQSTIECLTATCPHAGCFVAYDGETGTFKCPCHNSSFTPDGAIIPPSPSPRAMDSLDTQVRADEILVKFENFYTGKTEKIVKQ